MHQRQAFVTLLSWLGPVTSTSPCANISALPDGSFLHVQCCHMSLGLCTHSFFCPGRPILPCLFVKCLLICPSITFPGKSSLIIALPWGEIDHSIVLRPSYLDWTMCHLIFIVYMSFPRTTDIWREKTILLIYNKIIYYLSVFSQDQIQCLKQQSFNKLDWIESIN